MGSLTKALIGKEDVDVADDELYPSTFSRLNSTGSTITLTSFPDIWKTHQSAINARAYGTQVGATINAAVAAGTTSRDIYLDAGEWVVSTSVDWSAYTTTRWIFSAGAYLTLNAGVTVTFPSPASIVASPNQQIFSGTGTVAFSSGGEVYPDWWTANASPGTTDMAVAINLAMAAAYASGSSVRFNGATYYTGTTAVNHYPEVIARGQGIAATIIRADGTIAWQTCDTTGLATAATKARTEYPQLFDMTINGNDTGTDGVHWYTVSKGTMQNVLITNFTGKALELCGGAQGAYYSHFFSVFCRNSGVGIQFTDGAVTVPSTNSFHGIQCSSNDKNIYFSGTCGNNVFFGGDCEGDASTTHMLHHASTGTGNAVYGMRFEQSGGVPLVLFDTGAGHFIFVGNLISGGTTITVSNADLVAFGNAGWNYTITPGYHRSSSIGVPSIFAQEIALQTGALFDLRDVSGNIVEEAKAPTVWGWNEHRFGATHGNYARIVTRESEITLSGATTTWAGIIPAGSIVLGVSARVTTLIEGATSFDVGESGGDVDLFLDGIAVAADTIADLENSNAAFVAPKVYQAATSILITAVGGAANFSAGKVRLTLHYIELIPATS